MIIKRFRQLAAAAIVSSAIFCSTGCSLSALTAENVMEPPQAFGDGAQLQAAMEEVLGPQITLRYPRSGEHRSAVVRADVDGDDFEEAIVFYRPATESAGARMVLLDTNEEEEWKLMSEFAEGEGEIDRVVFGDVNGDGGMDIITGWSAYSDYCTIFVHSCSNGRLIEQEIEAIGSGAHALSSYTELSVGDFDGDGVDELLTVSMASGDDAGEARLLKWQHTGAQRTVGAVRRIGQLALNSGATDYTSSAAGMLAWNLQGIAVDSRRADGGYASEMVYWDSESGALALAAGDDGEELFTRVLSTESADIDGDGYIEVACDSLLSGHSSTAVNRVYLTDWYCFNSRKCVKDFSAVMRPDSGYYFIFPERWQGLITARPDPESHSLRFYRADAQHSFSNELMCIRVFTQDEWEEESSGGWNKEPSAYTEICTTDYYVYAVQISSEPLDMNVNYEAVLRYFKLML